MSYIDNEKIFGYLVDKTNIKRISPMTITNVKKYINENRLYITTHLSVLDPITHNKLKRLAHNNNINWITYELFRETYTDSFLKYKKIMLTYSNKK